MATIIFTKDELKTLVWAIQNQYAKETLRLLKEGEKPYENETIKKLIAINEKAYYTLVEEENK